MNNRTKTPAEAASFVQTIAERRGWELSVDVPFRLRVEEGLATTYNRNRYYLCPCRDGDGEREADADIICPCAYAQADIDEHGHCFCALFWRRGLQAQGQQAASVPERRWAGQDQS